MFDILTNCHSSKTPLFDISHLHECSFMCNKAKCFHQESIWTLIISLANNHDWQKKCVILVYQSKIKRFEAYKIHIFVYFLADNIYSRLRQSIFLLIVIVVTSKLFNHKLNIVTKTYGQLKQLMIYVKIN